jgi:hypothetical protein
MDHGSHYRSEAFVVEDYGCVSLHPGVQCVRRSLALPFLDTHNPAGVSEQLNPLAGGA